VRGAAVVGLWLVWRFERCGIADRIGGRGNDNGDSHRDGDSRERRAATSARGAGAVSRAADFGVSLLLARPPEHKTGTVRMSGPRRNDLLRARRPCVATRALIALASVTALACGAASPASATPLPPSPAPLPGSSFQGADGDQDDAPGLLDWQGLQAAGAVKHSPDPNDQDSAFAGGSKENEPGSWALVTEAGGVTPGSSNIRDAWSAVDQPAADTFVYLGFSRASASGTTFLAFELNHDARLWDNGNDEIPCRRTGDVQIAYEAHGNDIDVRIRRWTTTSTDLGSGCARTGRFGDAASLVANVDAQGAINAQEVLSRLPGFYDDTLALQRFGEASLNLARLLEAAFGDECLAFGAIWMHSRSSDSESASLKDYVAPRVGTHVRRVWDQVLRLRRERTAGRRGTRHPAVLDLGGLRQRRSA
jgi:hypothetical protein